MEIMSGNYPSTGNGKADPLSILLGEKPSTGKSKANPLSFNEDFWNQQAEEYGIDIAGDATSSIPGELHSDAQQSAMRQGSARSLHEKIDMSRMDQLLAVNTLSDVDDLGGEVFSMLDRFNSAVNQFGEEYTSACDERAHAIGEANADAKLQRERIEQEHTANLDSIRREADRAIENLNIQLREANIERQKKLQTATNELSRFRVSSEEELRRLHADNEAQSKSVKESVLDHVIGYYGLVTALVNKRIASEMEQSMAEATRKKLKYEEMRHFTSNKCVDEARSLYNDIYIECQKIIRRRLPDLCKQLAIVYCQAKRAYLMLLDMQKKAEETARAQYKAEVAKREESLEEIKKANKSEDERQQRDVALQTSQIKSSAETRTAEENTRYQEAKRQTNATIQTQDAELESRWFEELANRKTSFYQKMEVAFPVARMRELFNKLEALVEYIGEPFDLSGEPKHFIAIGRAKVDFVDSSRMNSEAYKIVLDWVRSNYQFMQCDPKNLRKISVPYIISVDKGTTLLLKHKDRFEDVIKNLVNGIGIRMLWSIPASLQEFCLLDTAAIGSYAPLQYMDPAQNPNAAGELIKSMIVGGKVFQKKEEMARQIDEMRTRFENRKGSMGSFKTLREFNSSYFMSREAYQAAIIQHFPMNLEADSVMDITTMARDCRMAGFSTILAMPETSESYMEEQVKLRVRDLESYVTVLKMRDDGCFVTTSSCQTEAERSAEITLFSTPDDGKLAEMREGFFDASIGALKVAVDFDSIAPDVKERYQTSSSQGLVIPLGLMRGGTKFELRMDDVHFHTILSGVIGAGKTNLLHVLLLNIMLRYSPDEAEIYLIDFKHGVDFGIYSNYNLPNFRVLSITSEAEFPLAALEEVEKEFDRRAFDLDGTLSIAEYNRLHPEKRMKRIVLILDELYALMKDSAKDSNKNIAVKIMQIIDKIAHQARAFGIHMLISGQDITKIEGIDNIINQFANRIVMHSSDEDVRTLLGGGDASILMHEIKPSSQGTCVFSSDYADTAKLAYTAKNESVSQVKLLEEISKHYTDLGEEANVRILLTEPSKSKYHPFKRFVDDGALPDRDPEKVQLFIGEPLTLLKDFNYYPDRNLWILGGDSADAEMAGYSTMFSSLMSLLLGKLKAAANGEEFKIFCADGSDDGSGNIDRHNRFWQFCDSLMDQGNLIEYVPGNELSMHIQKLTDIIRMRKDGESYYPVWLLVSMVEECYGVPEQDKMALRKILDDGPKKGIHTILWTKDAEFAKRFHLSDAPCDKLILETSDLDGFGIRIKQNIASGYKAQMLGSRGGVRIRLYDLPVQPWVDRILQRIDSL